MRKILLMAGMFLLMVSCQNAKYDLTGRWKMKDPVSRNENGIRCTMDVYYKFTPSSTKNTKDGTVCQQLSQTYQLDRLGSLDVEVSVPGSYLIKKSKIYIELDSEKAVLNKAFHPTTFWGSINSSLFDDASGEFETSIRADLEKARRDTLTIVSLEGDKLVLSIKGENEEFIRE